MTTFKDIASVREWTYLFILLLGFVVQYFVFQTRAEMLQSSTDKTLARIVKEQQTMEATIKHLDKEEGVLVNEVRNVNLRLDRMDIKIDKLLDRRN